MTLTRTRTGEYSEDVPHHAACSTDSPVICRVTREAEANKQKLTPEFLQMSFMTAISNNTKIYFPCRGSCSCELGVLPCQERNSMLFSNLSATVPQMCGCAPDSACRGA